ncbi:putative aldolase class 2 protein [Portunus trituberculatus]|uniref:Putative aldolase class 2 protein n=1 Tax=Portunus trituberculatus TaxID=210409 RepID=A0A5B7DFE2_PORTR|nr:putative aldolase class 2 protein [Portunus trituberculatus]
MTMMLGLRGVTCPKAVARYGHLLTRGFTSSYPKPYTVPEGPSGTNRAARLELAAAYRGLDHLGLNEGVVNHLSVMAPRADGKDGKVMLVFPEGIHWQEVRPSALFIKPAHTKKLCGNCKWSPETTASCIHLSIHKMRTDTKVVMHCHPPYTTALASLEDFELRMVTQNALRFWNRVAYDRCYQGVAYAFEEGERMARILGDKDILLLANHGAITVASTVSVAFHNLYFLERAAMVQMLAMATGNKLVEVPEEVPRSMSREARRDVTFTGKHEDPRLPAVTCHGLYWECPAISTGGAEVQYQTEGKKFRRGSTALIDQICLHAKINSAIAFSAMARLFRSQLGAIAEG